MPQAEAPVFARRWSELFGEALPAPAPVATVRVEEPAHFRLVLWRDEQGKRCIRPEVRYGEVAVDAQGRVHHPFGDEVHLELPYRSAAREKQWFGTVRVLLEPLRMALAWPDFAEYEAQAESPLLWHELRERLDAGVLGEFSPELEVADDFWPQEWEASTADVELAQADEGGDWFAFDAKVKAAVDARAKARTAAISPNGTPVCTMPNGPGFMPRPQPRVKRGRGEPGFQRS